MNKRQACMFGLVMLAASLTASSEVRAQSIVTQPVVQIVVGGAPGGLFDIALRIVSEQLGREFGKTIVIENRPGAGNSVALSFVKKANPDGLTVAMINVAAAANESIIKNRGYDLLADFIPVGMYAYPTNILIVNPEIRADSIKTLVDVLKTRGSSANYSSGGVGSPGHLAGEMFKARIGVPVTHIPYKGAPPAVLAVVKGEVDYMFATASSAIGQIIGGKVRALAVTTSERLPQLPGVPTMAEAGLTDFNVSDWVGFMLPKGTPTAIRDKLHAALVAAFTAPENRERLRNATFIPATPLGPTEFEAFLRGEVDKWAKIVAEAKISPR